MAKAFKCDKCYKLIEGDSKKELEITTGGFLKSLGDFQPSAIKIILLKDLCNKCIIDLISCI